MTDARAGTRTRLLAGGILVAVLAVAGAVGYFFAGSAPDEASLEEAVAVAVEEQVAGDSDGDLSPAGIDGRWIVDTSVGAFSFTDATSTFVGFRVGEELANIGQTEAVGRTPAVSGFIDIAGTTLAAAEIEADFTQLVTDRERRNNAVQRALDTGQFPTATFVLAERVDFGAIPAEGESIAVIAAGDLTIHGVTRRVEVPLEAQVVGDLIVVVGQFDVVFADFGVSVPPARLVLAADDFGTVELQLFFRRDA